MVQESVKSRPAAVILLAAGKGTRMRSAIPKVLHPIGGAPMLHHAMRAALTLEPSRVAVIVGHGAADVAAAARSLAPDAAICEQEEQLGTGHAVRIAEAALSGFDGDALVLFGDTPFITPSTLERISAERVNGADFAVLGFEAAEPGRYGRLVHSSGRLERIVEAGDATDAELAITSCNSGVLMADCATLFGLLARIGNANAQNEYYLTDAIGIACSDGLDCRVVLCEEAETLGINDRVQLAAAEAVFQARARNAAMLGGATLSDPESVSFAFDTVLGRDVTVGPNVVFGPGVHVADGARIEAFCHLEQCTIATGARIGPFARLRGGAAIGSDCRIGNFIEVKNATFGTNAKASHLSYIGDAAVGADANLGAGTITCNYDGFAKHRTVIGAGAFIGSNSALVAPVRIGPRAYVGSGSVITQDVPQDALAIARGRQVNKPGLAAKLRAKLAAFRSAAKGG